MITSSQSPASRLESGQRIGLDHIMESRHKQNNFERSSLGRFLGMIYRAIASVKFFA